MESALRLLRPPSLHQAVRRDACRALPRRSSASLRRGCALMILRKWARWSRGGKRNEIDRWKTELIGLGGLQSRS